MTTQDKSAPPAAAEQAETIDEGNDRAIGTPIEATEEERAVIDGKDSADSDAPSDTDAAPSEAAAPTDKPASDPDPEILRAVAGEATPPPAPSSAFEPPPPPPRLVDPTTPPKDFDKEFAALEQQLDDGNLTQAEFNKQTRVLTLEQARFEALCQQQQVLDADYNTRVSAAWDKAWQTDLDAFLSAHPRYSGSSLLARMLKEELDANNTPNLSNKELLEKADATIRAALRIDTTRASDDEEPAKPATKASRPDPHRESKLRDLPATLSGAPAAAPSGEQRTLDAMADMDIEELEFGHLARMDESSRDKLLRQLPGADGKPFGR